MSRVCAGAQALRGYGEHWALGATGLLGRGSGATGGHWGALGATGGYWEATGVRVGGASAHHRHLALFMAGLSEGFLE